MAGSARTIAGTVIDATGEPVADARVYITSAPGSVPDVAALTGADGRFRLTAPQPGSYQIDASSDAGGSGRVTTVVGPKDVTVEIKIAR
jgi:protocatechuate 3,4-dioxygenase beta subunit